MGILYHKNAEKSSDFNVSGVSSPDFKGLIFLGLGTASSVEIPGGHFGKSFWWINGEPSQEL
jgi:hypothetical protein